VVNRGGAVAMLFALDLGEFHGFRSPPHRTGSR